jgi:uncharacterized protein YjbJ (UPF0337 family)
MSTDRPERTIPGTGTTTTTPPTPTGGPPIASPPPQPADGLGDRSSDGGLTDTGAETGKEVADHARSEGKEVAGHARSEIEEATEHAVEQAQGVVETVQTEVRDVVDEAREAVRHQADRQAHVAADAVGRLRDDLRAMKDGDIPRDATAEYIERAARALDHTVERLERDGIEGALSGVRDFARRSPGGFLLASAGAGFALGRLLRNADHPQQVDEEQSSNGGSSGSGEQQIDITADATGRSRIETGRPEPFVGEEQRR